jgi:hypothetical protein
MKPLHGIRNQKGKLFDKKAALVGMPHKSATAKQPHIRRFRRALMVPMGGAAVPRRSYDNKAFDGRYQDLAPSAAPVEIIAAKKPNLLT